MSLGCKICDLSALIWFIILLAQEAEYGVGWFHPSFKSCFLGSVTHPPALSLALILTVDRICISARSWHEHSNDFISSSTCTNAYLGNITYWADCPIYFLFSKHMRPYLISPIAYWETYLSYTSMEGHTHTHTPSGVVYCSDVSQWMGYFQMIQTRHSALANITVRACAHTHTDRLNTSSWAHYSIPHMDIIRWSASSCQNNVTPLWCE